jgi:osomolarity two-component system response regulator SKN7
MDLLNSQLMATQQQLQGLNERYQELAQGHVVLLQQVVDLQKFVKNHERVMHSVMGYLHGVDASQRRNNRIAGYPNGNNMVGGPSENGAIDDRPATPLQRASALLGEFSAENLPSKDLEQMSTDYHTRVDYSTPPTDSGAPILPTHSTAASSGNIGYAVDKLDLENMVYPVGATNGIDPVNSEHIHNIPYSLPAAGMMPPNSLPPDIMPQVEPPQQSLNGRKKEDSIWGDHKPRILLVEDDKVCARIGAKFLQAFECRVDTAVSSRMRHAAQYIKLTLSSAMALRR